MQPSDSMNELGSAPTCMHIPLATSSMRALVHMYPLCRVHAPVPHHMQKLASTPGTSEPYGCAETTHAATGSRGVGGRVLKMHINPFNPRPASAQACLTYPRRSKSAPKEICAMSECLCSRIASHRAHRRERKTVNSSNLQRFVYRRCSSEWHYI